MKKLLFAMFALALLNGCASNSGTPKAESMIRIAHKARNSGNSEVAISFYNKALAIDPKNIDAYLGVADAHIDMNLLDAALGYIKKAEEAGAHKDRVHHIRGKIYLLQGNDKAAEKEGKEIDDFMPAWDTDFAGAIIIDDPIKPEDALSDTVRERVNNRFETTIRNRVNSRKTPIIIIMQRLHEHDLCGYLQEIEPDEWTVITLPCITYDADG